MRRLRVTAEMKKRLSSVRDAKGNVLRGGVMRVPPILSCDEFDALAVPMQNALIAASYEDRSLPVAPVVSGVDPAIVTHRYRVNR